MRAAVDAFDALVDACRFVTVAGTSPETVARLVAWAVRPRRSLAALRRLAREDLPGDNLDAWISQVTHPQLGTEDLVLAKRAVDDWRACCCRLSVVGDAVYPDRLMHGWPHVDAPMLLAWRGELAPTVPTVAIVGTRRASGYGVGVTAWLADAVASAGGRIVSGGAVGIDAAAHRAALELPGGTTVVLGCGHRVNYPRPHAQPGGLFDSVIAHGGAIISELFVDEPPKAYHVRARNRIVAGLADVVVVIEGGARSGALITAGAAAERDRTVLAVPGDIRASGSAAPHRLLTEGVAPCTGPDDLFDVLNGARSPASGDKPPLVQDGDVSQNAPSTSQSGVPQTLELSVLADDVRVVLAAAWPRPLRIDQLAQATGKNTGALLASLTRARVNGELTESVDGVRLRQRP